jgi:ATP-dependent RNA helicase RhlE
MKFSDLNLGKSLLNALDEAGFQSPTPIQEKSFNMIMSGRDMVGIAQTGTGKTLAYLLPSLRQWSFVKPKHPQVLIVVPTRELVMQVVEQIQVLTKYMNVVTFGVYGGVNMNTQALQLKEGADFIVATPGRLLDLTLSGALKLKHVKKFIIDEIDEMLGLGFRPQLIRVLDLLPQTRQNLMFSATMTEDVEALIADFFHHPEYVAAAAAGTPLEKITQLGYFVPNFYTKINLLKMIFEQQNTEMSKVLVFVGTKHLADLLHDNLKEQFGEDIDVIHSNKAQNYRFNTVNRFKANDLRVLIATDIVARGIDVSEVSHVINIDIPDEAENYIHRIGRTGRAEKDGIAMSFITEKEIAYQTAIEELMNKKITMLETPETLDISDNLIDDEIDKVVMPKVKVKITVGDGGAFHERSDKRKKVNVRTTKKMIMMAKYGKPQKKKPRKR